ncbi:5836_t:CDS:2 [Ambispora gerdemannii]|uniref:5836_t:CDS:1 n=1 Tax=Ambispora gerdemannii TaxID=144530 RepID=A0A9N9GG23_9GLOM|nr:5836_t:CDS:2 [Ambispora gerdemannii]
MQHMLAVGDNPSILISFLHTCIPSFQEEPIREVREAPIALPHLSCGGEPLFIWLTPLVISYRRVKKQHNWDRYLKPVIAFQIMGYDSERVQSIVDPSGVQDILITRVKDCPMHAEQLKFIKHYLIFQRKHQLSSDDPNRTPPCGKELEQQGFMIPLPILAAFGRQDLAKWNSD